MNDIEVLIAWANLGAWMEARVEFWLNEDRERKDPGSPITRWLETWDRPMQEHP